MNHLNNKKQFLTFNIDEVSYGVNINMVTEIISLQKITPVPELSHYIKGIINLRGKIIPLIDVRERLYNEERPYDDRTCVVVITLEEDEVGLIVDCVHEVISVMKDEEIISREEEAKQFISHVIKIEQKVHMIIDVKELISVE